MIGDRITAADPGSFPFPKGVSLVETQVYGYALAYYVERELASGGRAQLARVVKTSSDWRWLSYNGPKGRASSLSVAIAKVLRSWGTK